MSEKSVRPRDSEAVKGELRPDMAVAEKINLCISCFHQKKTGEIPMPEPPTFVFVEGVRVSEEIRRGSV